MAKAKKDFSNVNTGRVYNAIAEATAEPAAEQEIVEAAAEQEIVAEVPKRKARKTYTAQEAAEIMETLHTAGRKGIKLPRINLAFTPELHDYITTMSRARGETITDFVNKVLREHMEQHRDIYEKAIEFRNSL
jgi:FMN-dependent NADH-azoreductase